MVVSSVKKINVVGTSGSGKSTFSKQLAEKLNYPYIEMDALYWKANWEGSYDEEFFSKVATSIAAPCWVLDGNYSRTTPIKWQDVDTVVWIDYSFPRTIYQALKRAINRNISGHELWPDTGNRESVQRSFFSKDSVIIWTLKTFYSNRKRYSEVMSNQNYKHINFVRLTHPQKTKMFLDLIKSD